MSCDSNQAPDGTPHPTARRSLKVAVLVANVLWGALLVWALVRPLASQIADAVFFARFALFCVVYGILFGACDWLASWKPTRFIYFIGMTAAAVTASMYLQVGGIPSEIILLLITFFVLGFHGLAVLRAPEEERGLAAFKMLYSLSLSTVLFSVAVLLAAVLNLLLVGGPASTGAF